MWIFTRIADAYDKMTEENAKWIDSGLQPWVATTLYADSPWYRNVGVWTAAGTLFALNKFTATVAGGFIDVVRLGDGAFIEGGWRGWGRDALRLLVLVGPALRGARYGAGYFGAAFKGLDEGSVAAAEASKLGLEIPRWAKNCTWMAALRTLRLTGTRPLATLGNLAEAAGLTSITETGPAYVSEVVPALRNLGMRIESLEPGALSTMDDVARIVSRNPNGQVLFSVTWDGIGHTLVGVRRLFGGMRILDRTGGILVDSLKQLEALGYEGISKAVPYGPAAVAQDSVVVQFLEKVPSLANIIVHTQGAPPAPQPAERTREAQEA
jgi:hypothetical protein